MKNVDDLIEDATELAEQGFSKGQIADELNVSRETASWLVEQREGASAADQVAEPTDDIHVDWSAVGRDSFRLSQIGSALADLISTDQEIDLVVGIEKAGVPLATTVALELDADLGSYAPRKHQWEEGDIDEQDLAGGFSHNFADLRGRECYVIDDTITSGTTMAETVRAVQEEGGQPVGCGVLVDKQGVEELEGVPVHSLLQVIQVNREE